MRIPENQAQNRLCCVTGCGITRADPEHGAIRVCAGRLCMAWEFADFAPRVTRLAVFVIHAEGVPRYEAERQARTLFSDEYLEWEIAKRPAHGEEPAAWFLQESDPSLAERQRISDEAFEARKDRVGFCGRARES